MKTSSSLATFKITPKQLPDLIRACHESKVRRIKCGELEIDFQWDEILPPQLPADVPFPDDDDVTPDEPYDEEDDLIFTNPSAYETRVREQAREEAADRPKEQTPNA